MEATTLQASLTCFIENLNWHIIKRQELLIIEAKNGLQQRNHYLVYPSVPPPSSVTVVLLIVDWPMVWDLGVGKVGKLDGEEAS